MANNSDRIFLNLTTFVDKSVALLLYITVTTSIIVEDAASSSDHVTFAPGQLCDDDRHLCPESTRRMGRQLSELECARECQRDEQCRGFSRHEELASPMPRPTTCVLHYECLSVVGKCRNVDASLVYMGKRKQECDNNGTWLEEENRCDCSETGGWVGRFCSTAPRTCEDLVAAGYSPSLTHKITRTSVPLLGPKQLHCVLTKRVGLSTVAKTIILNYHDTAYPIFDKGWEDYEHGIYERNSSWIGFKHFKAMLDLVREKPLELKLLFALHTNEKICFTYKGVRLSDSSDGYRLVYSKVKPEFFSLNRIPITDCFRLANNSRFSTWDHDVDGVTDENCADKSRSGFWYSGSCRPLCNPFGIFYDPKEPRVFGFGPHKESTYIWAGQFLSVKMLLRLDETNP